MARVGRHDHTKTLRAAILQCVCQPTTRRSCPRPEGRLARPLMCYRYCLRPKANPAGGGTRVFFSPTQHASGSASPRQQTFHPSGGPAAGGGGQSFVPSLSVTLRGLFGGGMARCLERCLEEMAAAHENGVGGGGVTSQPSFQTAGTSGGSIGSAAGAAAATRSAARQKVCCADSAWFSRIA